MRLVPLPVFAAFALLSAGLATTSSANTDTETPQASRDVVFSNLSMQDGTSDNSICVERYGDGYTVSPSKEAPQAHLHQR